MMDFRAMSQAKQRHVVMALGITGTGVGMVMAIVGIFLGFSLGDWMLARARNDPQFVDYLQYVNVELAPSAVTLDVVASNHGYTLIMLGFLHASISSIAFIGAYKGHRPLLFFFIVNQGTLLTTENMSLVMILHRRSPISLAAKEAAISDMKHESSVGGRWKKDGHWVASFSLIMLELECCGIDGPKDYEEMFIDKYVPEVCCSRHFVHGKKRALCELDKTEQDLQGCIDTYQDEPTLDLSNCTTTRQPLDSGIVNRKGCYDAVFDAVISICPWFVPLWIFIYGIQMMTMLTALYMTGTRFKQDSQQLNFNPL